MDLEEAVKEGDVVRVKELLENGVDPRILNHWPIKYACQYGYADIVEVLLKDGHAYPNATFVEAMRQACAHGRTKVVAVLLQDKRVEPWDENLLTACSLGCTSIVKMLLRVGVDPSTFNNGAIQAACELGHIKVVEALLQDNRVDPTANNNWAIRISSEYGHKEVVKLLLQDGRVEPPDDIKAATEEIKDMLLKYKYRVDGPEYRRMKEQN
jgi:ankyrin repeat protein